MLQDSKKIRILCIPKSERLLLIKVLIFIFRIIGFKILRLGFYGENYFKSSDKFDISFYKQANVDFKHRYESFLFTRNQNKEHEIFQKLIQENEPYIFLHEDASRSYNIERLKLRNDLKIIQPLHPSSGYMIFDYLEIIRSATEIHVIESSFFHLIEGLDLPNNKFAHKYARPETFNDSKHSPSLISDWKIIY